NDLFILAGIVFHDQHPDGTHVDHTAGHQRTGVADQHVDGVAVVGQGVRHKAIVAGIGHWRIEKAVHHQCAGLLVHFVLDGMPADRYFDEYVDIFWGVVADGDGFDAHEAVLLLLEVWNRKPRIIAGHGGRDTRFWSTWCPFLPQM